MPRARAAWTLTVLFAAPLAAGCAGGTEPMQDTLTQAPQTVTVGSPAFDHDAEIPTRHTCDGADVSPALAIGGVGDDAKTLVVIVDDPDAPGKTWLHWTAWNLPAGTTDVPEGADVSSLGGTEGTTDFGRVGYGGPCPPSGTHRYFFKVFALDTELDLQRGAGLEELHAAMADHVVAWGQLMGTYARH